MTAAALHAELRRRVRAFVDGETTARALWDALGEGLAPALDSPDPRVGALALAACTALARLFDGLTTEAEARDRLRAALDAPREEAGPDPRNW